MISSLTTMQIVAKNKIDLAQKDLIMETSIIIGSISFG